MKKLIATGAAAALLFAATSPAAAQVTVSGDDNDAAQYVDASQVQLAIGVQYGDQNAAANDESEASASNELSIDQSQYNAGLGDLDLD
jgi:hypothetical protein